MESDTFHTVRKIASGGGVCFTSVNGETSAAYTEAELTGEKHKTYVSKVATTTSTAARAPHHFVSAIADGSGASWSNSANIFAVGSQASDGNEYTRFIIKNNGDIKYDGSAASYDSEDDLALVEVAKDLKNPDLKALESRQRLKELEIITDDPEDPNVTWVSHQKMQALQLGAISMLNKKLEETISAQQMVIDGLMKRIEKLEGSSI